MSLYPVFLELGGEPCLVVGGGTVAERKVNGLLEAGARVTVIAPEVTRGLRARAESGTITWLERLYTAGDLGGYRLAIAAANSSEVNGRVHAEARSLGVLVNAVDDPANCSFFVPAVVRRGPLCLAVSTSGAAPYLARRLREYLEGKFYPGLEHDLERLRELRAARIGGPVETTRRELEPLVRKIIERMERP